MKQKYLNPYETLVQSILDCHEDEQWLALKQQANLISFELIQTLELSAQKQIRAGHLTQGNQLHKLAGQLYHLLTQDELQPVAVKKTYDPLIYKFLEGPVQTSVILPTDLSALAPQLMGRMQELAEKYADEGKLNLAQRIWALSDQIGRQYFREKWLIHTAPGSV